MPVSRKCPGHPMCLKTFDSGQGWKAHVACCPVAAKFRVVRAKLEDSLNTGPKREEEPTKVMTLDDRIRLWRQGKFDLTPSLDSSKVYDSYYNDNHRVGEVKKPPRPQYGRVSAMVRYHKDPRIGNITVARKDIPAYYKDEGEFKRV